MKDMLEVDSVFWEQCYFCREWQPIQEMQWDEAKQAYACGECFDSIPLW